MKRRYDLGLGLLSGCCLACTSGTSHRVDLPECPGFEESAAPDISGTYRYESALFRLSGTIVFEQADGLVRVADTTYDDGKGRPLTGEGMPSSNFLDVTLVPQNGDTDYVADVSLAFDAAGANFCVRSFSDTNGDQGPEGSYTGERLAIP